MNAREKKLGWILFGAAFLIVNVFLYLSYREAMQRKLAQLSQEAGQLEQMETELATWKSRQADLEWLENNPPAEGNHGKIGARLVKAIKDSAVRWQMDSPAVSPQRADADEMGVYRSAKVKVKANATDEQLYKWLSDLQDPQKSRSVTFLRVSPNRDDPERVDCELEVTQWFAPEAEQTIEPIE